MDRNYHELSGTSRAPESAKRPDVVSRPHGPDGDRSAIIPPGIAGRSGGGAGRSPARRIVEQASE
jgi:hypothetical protein